MPLPLFQHFFKKKTLERKSVNETWSYLEIVGQKMPRYDDERPFIPERMPDAGDAANVFSFINTRTEYVDFSNLTLPRILIVRSKFATSTFSNTSFKESRICHNQFYDCDFSNADFSNCDLRASTFVICTFANATLQCADLRHAVFKECIFRHAVLNGAQAATDMTGLDLLLTRKQSRTMIWNKESGPEPET